VISRRRIRGWIALLLPLMVLRALLPAGYMPVAADGELRIVMCSAGLDTLGHHDRGHGQDDGTQAQQASCPFAHAATLAPPNAVRHQAIASPVGIDIAAAAQRTLPTSPYRFAAARGPPRYS
jgi:hypothetical protein